MNQQNQNGVQQNQANAYRQTNAGTTGYGYTPNQYVQRQGQPSVPYQQQTAVQYPAQQSAQKSSGGKIAIAIVAVVLVVGLLGIGAIAMLSGGYYSVGGSNTAKNGENAVSFNEVETPKTDTTVGPSGELLTPAQVAAKVRPSIVSVITVDNVKYMNSNSGEGSGIILKSDGYIVTNSHVIGDSSKYDVSVITSEGKTYDAKVVGYDVRSDLAVLKIDATGLPECELGDSSQLVLGDYVMAIGNPGGRQFAGSVTLGLISYGYVEGRVKLGITCATISSAYESQGIPAGLQIYDINSDSDMNGKAQKYDIITHCEGKRITELSQLQDIMSEKKAGDTIKLTIYRPASQMSNSETFDIEVRLLKDTGSTD